MSNDIEIGDLVKAKKTFNRDSNQFEWGDFFGEAWEWALVTSVDNTNFDNVGPIYGIKFIDGNSIFVYVNNIELISKCGKNSRDDAPGAQEEKNGRKKI